MADRVLDDEEDNGDGDAGDQSGPGSLSRLGAGLLAEALEERERWGLWMPVGFGFGIALYFALPTEPPPWLGLLLAAVTGALAAVVRRRPAALIGTLAVFSVVAGFAAAQVRTALVAAPMLDRELKASLITARVFGVERLANGTRLVLGELTVPRLAPAVTPERARLRLGRTVPAPVPGSFIEVRAVLRPPPAPVAPGAFDFQRQLFFDGIGAVGYAVGTPRTIDGPPQTLWRRLLSAMEELRQEIAVRVDAVIEPPTAAVTIALLNGQQTGIAPPVMQDFRNSGLAHLLSISGLHISLVAGLVMFAARALLAAIEPVALRWPIKKLAAALGLMAAVAYMLVVGAPVPTLRSVLMTTMVMVAIMVDRNPFSMRLVAAAALLVMLVEPESLLGPSFQMSFGAVVALIAATEALGPRWRAWRRAGGWWRLGLIQVGGMVATSVAATLATTPFSLYHFQQLTFHGVFANMVAIPLTTFWVMPWSLLVYLGLPFGLEAGPLIAMGWGVFATIEIARVTASLPGAAALVPAMPLAGLIAIVAGGLWLCLWQRRWRLWGLLPILAGLITVPLARQPDILVAGDGKLMAVRGADGGLSLSTRRAARFEGEAWLRRDGEIAAAASVWPGTGTSADGRLSCDVLGCLYRVRGRTVALVRDREALLEDCDQADVVISAAPVRRCPAPLVIDRGRLRRDGTHALYLSAAGVEVDTVRVWRGQRPWTGP